MKSVLLYQSIGTSCSVGNIVASVGVEKDRLHCICAVTIPSPAKVLNCRLHDCQWIAASALANVQMKPESGFLREEPDERRSPDFALAFAAHEDAPALGAMAIDPRH